MGWYQIDFVCSRHLTIFMNPLGCVSAKIFITSFFLFSCDVVSAAHSNGLTSLLIKLIM